MKRSRDKTRVLFIGSFRPAASDGTVGGQMAASQALINSGISRYVNWVLLDSTQFSLPLPPVPVRVAFALKRLVFFLWKVRRVDAVLLFAQAASFSLVEKGTMALVGHVLGKRVVISLRSEFPSTYTTPFTLTLLRRILSFCDAVWVQSESAKETVKKLLGQGKTETLVIPNFLNLKAFTEDSCSRDGGDEPDGAVFLYAGWFIKEKGLLDLIEAFRAVVDAAPSSKLVLCGHGPEFGEVNARAGALGLSQALDFRGWVSHERMKRILKETSVLVLPSYSEGMPNVVLEAMAAGMPVVATEVGGTPDLVTHGTTGYLFRPGDTRSLSEYMTKLALDKAARRSMGMKGKEEVSARFEADLWWPKILERLQRIGPAGGR